MYSGSILVPSIAILGFFLFKKYIYDRKSLSFIQTTTYLYHVILIIDEFSKLFISTKLVESLYRDDPLLNTVFDSTVNRVLTNLLEKYNIDPNNTRVDDYNCSFNAWSLRDLRASYIVLNYGLVKSLKPRESFAVLMHEIGHVIHFDTISNIFLYMMSKTSNFLISYYIYNNYESKLNPRELFTHANLIELRITKAWEYLITSIGYYHEFRADRMILKENLKEEGISVEMISSKRDPVSYQYESYLKVLMSHPCAKDRIARLKSG